MAKFLATFFLMGFLSPVSALALSNFSGHWKGVGTFQTGEMTKALDVEFDLVIVQSKSHLSIRDCWFGFEPLVGKYTTCHRSEYRIDEEDRVFAEDRRIGDIFPDRILIFQGNDHASELMSFALNERREMRFRYASSNFDGNLSVRFAQLRAEPSGEGLSVEISSP